MLGVSYENIRKFCLPTAKPAPPATEPTLSELGKAIKAGEAAAAERAEIPAALRANFERLQQAEAAFSAERQRLSDRDRELNSIEVKGREADQAVRRRTRPSDSEMNFDEDGKKKLVEVEQLAHRYGVHESVVLPVEECEVGKEFANIVVAIADVEADIKRYQDRPDSKDLQTAYSRAERRLDRLQRERSQIELQLEAHRLRHQRWAEIQATKAEADRLFAERDRLRKEREDAAIAAALKGK